MGGQTRTTARRGAVVIVAAVALYWVLTPTAPAGDQPPASYAVNGDAAVAGIDQTTLQGAFADAATKVWDTYPNQYVSARWNGDGGTITVTRDVADEVVLLLEGASVPITVEAVDGMGTVAANGLASDAIDKLHGVVEGTFGVDIDPATGAVTVTIYGEDPNYASDALKAEIERALGYPVTLDWQEGAISLY